MYDHYDHGGGWGWGAWLMMSITMLILLTLVAWGVYAIWRSSTHPHPTAAGGTGAPPDPLAGARAILAERLARGEIDAAEYRERLDALPPPG